MVERASLIYETHKAEHIRVRYNLTRTEVALFYKFDGTTCRLSACRKIGASGSYIFKGLESRSQANINISNNAPGAHHLAYVLGITTPLHDFSGDSDDSESDPQARRSHFVWQPGQTTQYMGCNRVRPPPLRRITITGFVISLFDFSQICRRNLHKGFVE